MIVYYLWLVQQSESHLLDLNSHCMPKLPEQSNMAATHSINPPPNLNHITVLFIGITCAQTYSASVRHPIYSYKPPYIWPKCVWVLPAVACKSSRETKQQIETAPFMMAARRTLIVTQSIYTKAGRLKGMQKEEAGHRKGQLVEGLRSVCVLCIRDVAGVIVCHRDSTHTSSWLSFLERLQLRSRHQCNETWSYFQCWRHAQILSGDNHMKICFRDWKCVF